MQDLKKTQLARTGLAAVVIAIVIVGVLSVVGRSGGRPATPVGASDSQTDREVSAVLDGIPQSGYTLGQPTAPVTLEVFLDLECLTSKLFVVSFLPSIIYDWVRTNNVKIEFHSRETDTHNPRAFVNQQTAALAAGAQGKLWNFVDTFYHEQGPEYTGYVTESYLNGIASQVPDLNLTQWESDRQNKHYFGQLVADRHTAIVRRLRSTPALLIGRTGGKMMRLPGYEEPELPGSLVDAMTLKEAIEKLP
ncbi:MAG TPA: thioredoxin domain-containing protein [Solirubrobacteraceae bacterium]|nr:thioredoxin domain-containing protein [Solirubrobacteraceae bacterium]